MLDRSFLHWARAGLGLTAGAAIVACTDTRPTDPSPSLRAIAAASARTPDPGDPAAPSGTVTLTFGSDALTFFPYTGDDFTGTPKDPINAIFSGYADPLMIRAALRRLGGDRSAFGLPNAPPFNCTWKDAIGDEQTAYGAPEGWTGSAVQLACGEFTPMRFHMRLFNEGRWTIAGIHMDLHVPNTHEHEVISWELPEQVLMVDMIRTGLLSGSPGITAPITQTPTFREIRLPIYNGIPVALKALVGILGGPALPNDGRARLFDLRTPEPVVADLVEQDFTIQFNQVIPKPFCGGPTDYLFVQGPVVFRGLARVTEAGIYHREQQANAQLVAVPINPLTGQPTGATLEATVTDEHVAGINPAGAFARSYRLQQLFDAGGVLQASQADKLSAGTLGHDDFTRVVKCGM